MIRSSVVPKLVASSSGTDKRESARQESKDGDATDEALQLRK